MGQALKDGHIADLHLLGSVSVIGGANVHVQIGHFDARPAARQGLCPLSGTNNAPETAGELHPGVDDLGGIVPADVGDGQKALFVNAGDHKADGVHVGTQHDFLALALFMADQIAQSVGGDLVHIRGGHFFQNGSDTGLLGARGTCRGH